MRQRAAAQLKARAAADGAAAAPEGDEPPAKLKSPTKRPRPPSQAQLAKQAQQAQQERVLLAKQAGAAEARAVGKRVRLQEPAAPGAAALPSEQLLRSPAVEDGASPLGSPASPGLAWAAAAGAREPSLAVSVNLEPAGEKGAPDVVASLLASFLMAGCAASEQSVHSVAAELARLMLHAQCLPDVSTPRRRRQHAACRAALLGDRLGGG